MAKKAAPKVTHPKATATPKAAPRAAVAPAPKATPKAAATPAPKAAPKAADTSTATRPKPTSKTALYSALAEKTGLDRKQIARFFDALNELIGKELGKKGPGQVVLPGLVKLKVVRKPATKARPGRNPHTGAPITIQAKPARNVVRAVPIKALKEMV